MAGTEPRPTKYWLVVVSRDHVEIGKRHGIVMANHGKAAPLRRMRSGDSVVCYSPKAAHEGKEPLKKFTAIARVSEGEVYHGELDGGFTAYRRDVEYLPCDEADIVPLIHRLTFIRDKQRWGYLFRFGFFEVPEVDFQTIAAAMHHRG